MRRDETFRKQCPLRCVAWVIATMLVAGSAWAQSWQPVKPVEISIPTTPGGGIDRTGRTLQRIFQEAGLVKVPVTVVNKPGGGGAVSVNYINQHAGDAHYIAINSPNLIANDLNGRGRYTEVTPLATMFSEYTVIAVRAESPILSGQDFVERLRKDAGSLAVSTPTTLGSINHLSFALVAKSAGVDIRRLKPVVLGSGADGVTAVLGGHVDAHSGTPSSVVRMVEAGRMRVIGVLAPRRIGGPFANTPTWTEQGYRAVMDTWRGVIGPKGMTADQIAFWDQVLAKAAATDTWKREVERNVWQQNYLNSAQTKKLFEDDYAEYKALLTELGLVR